MQAIINERYGGPEVMQLRDVPKPTPTADQVLIKVMATSLNAYDWHMLMADPFFIRFMFGLRAPKMQTLGADVAGVVEAVGANVTRFQPGDAVYGELAPTGCGGLAEYVVTTENLLASKPENLTWVETAALPMAALTALQGLRDIGGLQPGMKVLINGASGGVGTYAVQIAKALGGEVTAVCSTAKVGQARALGADHVIDYTREDFTRNGQAYDLIFGANGNLSLGDYERALAPGGVFVMAGGTNKQMFQTLLLGGLKSRGDKQFKNFTAHAGVDDLLVINDMVAAGQIRPAIDRCYPLAETPDAMRYLIDGHAKGKIVVVVDPTAAA
jgi:NADPH:quinone reductase-like Zn-dependent oxidoreductase